MSTITPNLSLFKIIPQEDAKKTFDFYEILNNNWDKVDNSFESMKIQLLAEIKETLDTFYNTVYKIGQPLIRLDDTIYENEVRLNGDEKLISEFPELYAVYGNTYGTAQSGYFKLPDFTNRTFWGSDSFGYLAAGLPNIKGSFRTVQKNDRTTVSGAFTRKKNNDDGVVEPENNTVFNDVTFTFNASNNVATETQANGIYRKNCYTVQPPALKVRVVTRYR